MKGKQKDRGTFCKRFYILKTLKKKVRKAQKTQKHTTHLQIICWIADSISPHADPKTHTHTHTYRHTRTLLHLHEIRQLSQEQDCLTSLPCKHSARGVLHKVPSVMFMYSSRKW